MGFWRGKRVFITGHTGFKGSWLALALTEAGAEVTGYSLPPPTRPSLFEAAEVGQRVRHVEGDVRDASALAAALKGSDAQIVFHLAAQSLVRLSYAEPVETFDVNVMGTAHLLQAVRGTQSVRAVVVATSDKCYENRETGRPFVEDDPMGGHDPYSASKGCAELVVAAWRRSFFSPATWRSHGVGLASGRAGNVIGGGDWAADRLVPDLMRDFAAGEATSIRSPEAVRPWQHVLEPLAGYRLLAQRLFEGDLSVAEGWNFGPDAADVRPVRWIADTAARLWGDGAAWRVPVGGEQPHEARLLSLDCTKARESLGWWPLWPLEIGLEQTVAWYRAWSQGADALDLTLAQIRAHAPAQHAEAHLAHGR